MATEKQVYLRSALNQIKDKNRPGLDRTKSQKEDPTLLAKCKTRQVPDVPEPAWHKPEDDELFFIDGLGQRKPNPDYLKSHLLREGRLTDEQALFILQSTRDVLSQESNLLELDGPITVCGDIHGQYYDLMKIFEIGGDVKNNSYLFLGDYVDRGSFGIECLLLLYAYKLCYPRRIFLLRGNHECLHLTTYFTFLRECQRKYSQQVYEASIASFNALPLAAVLDRRFFCVHGGISPELTTVDEINRIDRFMEPPSHGLLCDLLWSDPLPDFDTRPERDHSGAVNPTFSHNPARGCSFLYSYEAVSSFIARNNFLGIIRGHEVQQQGFKMYRKTHSKKFPSVITIFSAPNYCDIYHNRGAVLKYVNKNITIRQYNYTHHPYWLPNFMDAFTWSLPFVGDKITQMLLGVLQVCSTEELEETLSDEEERKTVIAAELDDAEGAEQRRTVLRNKILAVGKMQMIFKVLREESELASEINNATMEASGNAALRNRGFENKDDALGVRGNQIRRTIRNFDDARRSDLSNERMPDFVVNDNPAFNIQAPSTRLNTDDGDFEKKLHRTLSDDDIGDWQELADNITRSRGTPANRPSGLRRYGTA